METGFETASRLIRAGQLSEASRALDDIATLDPENARLLGLQGIVALQAGNNDQAVDLLTRSLAGDGPAPAMRRSIQALLSLGISLKSAPLIEHALERPVPADDAGLRQGPEERDVLIALVEQLSVVGRTDQALAVLEPFMAQLSDEARFLELFGALKLAAGRPKEALTPLKQAFGLDHRTSRLLLNLGTAAHRVGDRQSAENAATEFVNRFPLYVSRARVSQKITIGVANWSKQWITSRRAIDFHFPGNFISQLAKRHPDRYRMVSVLFDSPAALQAMTGTPDPDIVFNAVANAEGLLKIGARDTFSTLAMHWAGPVVNHPDKVLRTDRHAAPLLYGGLDNWLIPKIARYSKDDSPADLADRIEDDFDYPVIVRGLSEQRGKNMWCAEKRSELVEAIVDVEAKPFFYAIQFYESRHEDGFFRKLRAAVAGDTMQIIWMDHEKDWHVSGRAETRKVEFYARYPDLVQHEVEACRDADAYFGQPVMDALRALRSRNPLDVFGIDFDVMPDGRLLYFEANASMKLMSNLPFTHPDVPPHPQEAEDMFLAGFDRYLERLKG